MQLTYPYPETPIRQVWDTEGSDGSHDVHGAVRYLLDVSLPVAPGQTTRQHVGVSDCLDFVNIVVLNKIIFTVKANILTFSKLCLTFIEMR